MLGQKIRLTLGAIVLMFAAIETSHAIPLDIDFRDHTEWGGFASTSYSNDGVTVDANGRRLWRDNRDGYGILGGEWDEIDRQEMLTVWFDDEFFDDPGNWLTGVLLTDLFPARDGGPGGEAGWVTLFDGIGNIVAEFFVNAVEYVANGEFFVDFGGAYAPDHIEFTAHLGPEGAHIGSEFSVAGFTTRSVPEPGTLALLGVSLLMIAYSRRRRISLVRP